MSDNERFSDQLQFPCECHFRIIAINRTGMFESLAAALRKLGIDAALEESHTSKEGTYKSFCFSMAVWSHEEMDTVDKVLRAVDGVKMVL
jgi:putative lipoic acid-binding regulatory protein